MIAVLNDATTRLIAEDIVTGGGEKSMVGGEHFVRTGQVSLGIDSSRSARGVARIVVIAREYMATNTTWLDVDASFLDACRWINALETGASFGALDVCRAGPSLEEGEVAALLDMLERVRLVRVVGERVR